MLEETKTKVTIGFGIIFSLVAFQLGWPLRPPGYVDGT